MRLAPVVAAAAFAALAHGCASDSGPAAPQAPRSTDQTVVYGDDDRTDYYAVSDENLRKLTRESIVALVRPFSLDRSDADSFTPSGSTLGDRRDLCEGERFAGDPTMAFCSGTLIDDDLVLTAGHCIDDQGDCEDTLFVFDYLYESEGQLATITAEDVYGCAQLVTRRNRDGIDYAVVQLDREVDDERSPAPVRAGDDPMQVDDPITVIGFGSGIPAKVDTGGRVTDARETLVDYFEGTPDTFGGNSGSGVFDANGEVVGILVRGATDYVDDGSCTRVNTLPADGGGDSEDMTYASRAIASLCETEVETTLCDGRGGYCRPCSDDEACLDGFGCIVDPEARISYCTEGCATDDDCRPDHRCSGDGVCLPELSTVCVGDDVYTVNACGAEIEIVETCGDGQLCYEGACADPAAGDTCSTAIAIDASAAGSYEGELTPASYTDAFFSGCGGSGIDVAFALTIEDFARSVVFESSGFDTILSVRSDCGTTRDVVDCNDDSNPPGGRGSRIEAVLEPGNYTVVLESAQFDEGPYELTWTSELSCPCEVGATQCDGGTLQVCEDGPICPDWVDDPCDAGATCVEGACVAQSEGDTCEDAFVLDGPSNIVTGDLSAGYADNEANTCASSSGDAFYVVELVEPARLTATLDAAAGSSLGLRRTCDAIGTELECGVIGEGPTAIEAELTPDTYYLLVDGGPTPGAYTLDVSLASTCSDQCGPDGALTCIDQTTYRACGQFDEDACLDFGPTETCPENSGCTPDGCVALCEDECEAEGALLCVDDGTTGECRDQDGDGCLEIVTASVCDEGESCVDGACEGPAIDCSVDCDPALCEGCDEPPADAGGSGGGCAATGSQAPAAAWWLALGAWVAVRRRRG